MNFAGKMSQQATITSLLVANAWDIKCFVGRTEFEYVGEK
jgi:hypothetical protein